MVVDKTERWPLEIPDVEVVSARGYITEPESYGDRRIKVFNLCRSYRYQSTGYYVSLLATARGQRPTPSVVAIQDLKSTEIARIRTGELDEEIQRALRPIKSDTFVLSVYFGRNVAKRYDRLSSKLLSTFGAPLLRATFRRLKEGAWQLASVRAIAVEDVRPEHRDLLLDVARDYFARRRFAPRASRKASRYDLAVLVDPNEEEPPSNERTVAKFAKAAQSVGMTAWKVGKSDYAQLAEYDALFIRTTTNVNHYTYRFAQRGRAEGMVVVDDPESILRCTNKVYLAELLARHGLPAPATMVLHRGNIDDAITTLGLPCVLKQPDGAFSHGVKKADTEAQLRDEADRMLATSELIIAQQFTPTEYDWRVGIFDDQPLWVCKYHMASHHWQIAKDHGRQRRYGLVESVPVHQAPKEVVRTALRAARLIGHGLYGVDLKQLGRRACVIEVNDNPTIDNGQEDGALGDYLYQRIMEVFVRRLDAAQRNGGPV